MKKLLAIIGSPRKGETYHAVERLAEEFRKQELVEIDYVMLRDIDYRMCTGCHACIMRGNEFCPEAEKVSALQDRMRAADAVILASPVYNQLPTALMKLFLDYFTFQWHRPEMFGVKFIGVSSGGGQFGGVFKTLKQNVEAWGGIWLGELGVPHYDALTEGFRKKCDRDAAKKAKALLRAMDGDALPRATVGKMIWFNMWKMNAVAGKSGLPRDYEYWTQKGWLASDFYYKVPFNPLRAAAVGVVTAIMRATMHKIYIGY